MATVVPVPPRPSKRATITAIYAGLGAPDWAAPNLDGLADVLRDLSWREPGPVTLHWQVDPQLPVADLDAIHDVIAAAAAETARSPRPVRLVVQ
jgi:hypothetical protein